MTQVFDVLRVCSDLIQAKAEEPEAANEGKDEPEESEEEEEETRSRGGV